MRRLAWLLPILLTAMLTGSFLYQSQFDERFRYTPFHWQARWMQSPFAGRSLTCFRKTFVADGRVKAAYLTVAADNFYSLYVNEQQPKTFFHGEAGGTYLPPTSYSELGMERHKNAGVVFNIAPYLHPGRNAICIIAETDEPKPPALAVQAVVDTARRQVIVSDNTWKCAPSERHTRGVSWTSENYPDLAWPAAVATSTPVTSYVDGDPTVLDEPLRGYFIGASVSSFGADVHLRKVINCPGGNSSGWMRIHWNTPYNLSLNGRLIAGSMFVDRYPLGVVKGVPQRDQDNIQRIDSLSKVSGFPDAGMDWGKDVIVFKHILKPGPNVIDITLHGQDHPEFQRIPTVYLDAHVNWADGSQQAFWTDETWKATTNGHEWKPATVISYADRNNLASPVGTDTPLYVDPGAYNYEITALYAGMAFLIFLIVGVLACLAFPRRRSAERLTQIGSLFIAPAIILTASGLLALVFGYSPQDEYFSSPQYASLALAAAAIVGGVTAAVAVLSSWTQIRPPHDWGPGGRILANQYGFAAAMVVIVVGAAVLYLRGLSTNPFIPDEYVSILAARGILRHGLPVFENDGIIYTRSAIYHYLLAGFLWIGNATGNMGWARVLGVLWELAMLPVIYLFGRELRSKYVGLAAATIVAFSPYMIFFAREARFYSQLAFFTTLIFYLLYRSIKEPDNDRLRIGVILAFCCSFLSQQVAMVSIPAAAAAILFAGQTRAWIRPKMIPWLLLAIATIVVDLATYLIYCVTPLPYVDRMAAPLMGVHTDYLEVLPSMLLDSVERSQLVVGIFYVAGLIGVVIHLVTSPQPSPWKGERATTSPQPSPWKGEGATGGFAWWKYLYLITLISMTLYTIIIPDPKSRYVCQIFPATALTACCVAAYAGAAIRRRVLLTWRSRGSAQLVYAVYAVATIAVFAAEQRPIRTWDATHRLVNNDFTKASRFVASHRRAGDKIIYSSPEIAMVELGNCDYDWRPNEASLDKYIAKDGRLRERDSGGIVIDDVDKLRAAITQNDRVWLVVVPRYALNSKLGATVPLKRFVDDNFEIAYEGMGSEVCLWDRGYSHYRPSVANRNGDQFLY